MLANLLRFIFYALQINVGFVLYTQNYNTKELIINELFFDTD